MASPEPKVISSPVGAVDAEAPARPRTHYRWVICALLFFITTVNYMDRQVLGILAPTLEGTIGWSEAEYGLIVAAFQAAYAIGLLLVGRFIDVVGTKKGFSLAIVWWSIAAAAHALARTPLGFAVARFALGLGESANFPASIKAVSEWFPKKERALATGIFNGGTNVGVIAAAVLVPWLTLNYGWQWAFIVLGALGFVFLIAWLVIYRPPAEHPRVSPSELAYIRSDQEEEPSADISWLKLCNNRQAWAFAIGKFMTDPIWWFYLYWLPSYLDTDFGVELSALALPLVVVYLVSDVGSVTGGWLSSAFIKRGWTVNRGRKMALLISALAVMPIMLGPWVDSMWVAVGLVALATAAHQAWSANLFTTVSDMFPQRAVASVVGFGGMVGAVGGVLFAAGAGFWLEASGSNYGPLFFICGLAYIAALGIIHLLVPRLESTRLEG